MDSMTCQVLVFLFLSLFTDICVSLKSKTYKAKDVDI